jgi:excisionase family DNA binding protein
MGIVHVADVYFSLKGLAAYSGLSVRTLRSHLADRSWPLPHYRFGGKICVRRSDFDAWATRFRRDAAGVDAIADDLVRGL